MAAPTAAPGFLRPPVIDTTGLTDAEIIARWGHPAGDGDCRYDVATDSVVFYHAGVLKKLSIADVASLVASTLPDQADIFRSADVATMSRDKITSTAGTLATGRIYAGRALCKVAGTYTRIRFETGSTPPSGTYTDMRAGVWSSAGTSLLANTANEVATVLLSGTIYTLNLLAGGVTLTRAQEVFLGLGFIATTMPLVKGYAVNSAALAALTPVLARLNASGSWTTGNVPAAAITTANATAVPWMELLP